MAIAAVCSTAEAVAACQRQQEDGHSCSGEDVEIAEMAVNLLQARFGMRKVSSNFNKSDDDAPSEAEADPDKKEFLKKLNEKLAAHTVPKLNAKLPESIKSKGMDPMSTNHMTGLSSMRVTSFKAEDINAHDNGAVIAFVMDAALDEPMAGTMEKKGMQMDFKLQGANMKIKMDGDVDFDEGLKTLNKLTITSAKFDYTSSSVHCRGSGRSSVKCNIFAPGMFNSKKQEITAKVSDKLKAGFQKAMEGVTPMVLEQ